MVNSGPATVSVVIPVYNGEALVETAIQSVLEQTHFDVEIIAVDDGSPDRSAEVLRQFQDRITIVSQRNTGVAGARNRGIEAASGEFVAFLDQDDWWLPSKIARQLEVFRSDQEIALVHTKVAHVDLATGQEVEPLNPDARPEEMTGRCLPKLLLGNPIYNSSVVVRRSVLDRVGHCDAALAGNTVADYELWLRIAAVSAFGYVDEPLTCYRMHEQQGIWDRRAMLADELRVLQRIQDEKQWMESPGGRTRMADLYDALAVAWLDAGDLTTARRYFADSLRVAKSKRAAVRWAASRLPLTLVERVRR